MDHTHPTISAMPRALFSVEPVLADYTGPLFRVEPAIDLYAGYERAAMPTGTISVWYDQSGNGRHATQPDPAKRPRLVMMGAKPKVDFGGDRFLCLPDRTLPPGDEPYTVMFKHLEIANPVGGILGSGEYAAHNAVNAIRRGNDRYINYFWGNDLQTEAGSFKDGNVVAFAFSRLDKQTAFVNGIPNASREHVTGRFSAPFNTTIGKTYSDNEYLNGSLEFLYVLDEMAPTHQVTLDSGVWSR
jgi:hypothetical protein